MRDPFGREISYLRISVTDRCNLRCRYCMPAEGVKPLAHEDILRFEQIVEVAAEAIRFGFRKFRLTGGEPLVRRGVEDLVAMLAGLDGVEDLAMTTNGTLLAGRAEALKAAGLGRVNVSLDAIDPERYRHITRGGNVADAIAGIEAAIAAGLTPVKINCVVAGPDPVSEADDARRSRSDVRLRAGVRRRHDAAAEPRRAGRGSPGRVAGLSGAVHPADGPAGGSSSRRSTAAPAGGAASAIGCG